MYYDCYDVFLSFSYTAHIDTFADTIITNISCGVKHSLALSSDGSLYAWGDNSEGQLGLKTLQPICKPRYMALNTIHTCFDTENLKS